jgi:hypothetical protein
VSVHILHGHDHPSHARFRPSPNLKIERYKKP